MFVVLGKDLPEKNFSQITWYCSERKQTELVEITEISKRTLDQIKAEYPNAFIEEVEITLPSSIKDMFRNEPKVHEKVDVVRKQEVKHLLATKEPEKVALPSISELAKVHIPSNNILLNKYKCEGCGLESENLGGIRRHVTRMHGKGAARIIEISTGKQVMDEPELQSIEAISSTVVPVEAPIVLQSSIDKPKAIRRML